MLRMEQLQAKPVQYTFVWMGQKPPSSSSGCQGCWHCSVPASQGVHRSVQGHSAFLGLTRYLLGQSLKTNCSWYVSPQQAVTIHSCKHTAPPTPVPAASQLCTALAGRETWRQQLWLQPTSGHSHFHLPPTDRCRKSTVIQANGGSDLLLPMA